MAVLPKVKPYPNFAEVRLDIMKINDDLCTETFLGNLIAYVPSKDDDLKLLEKYQKETPEVCEELDIPEQFTIEVCALIVIKINAFCSYCMHICRCIECIDMKLVFNLCFSECNFGRNLSNWKR